jgi:hypothetical protein
MNVSRRWAPGRMATPALLLGVALATGALSCAHKDAVTGPPSFDRGAVARSSIQLISSGGIAVLYTLQVVHGSGPDFLTVNRTGCSIEGCQVLLDSASGVLSLDSAQALFAAVSAESPFTLADDYGVTTNGADMKSYVLTVTLDGRTKSIRADDGTMPPPMRRITDILRAAIAAGRH